MKLSLSMATGVPSQESLELCPTIFGRDFNEALVHQVVTAYLAGARSGTRAQKTRAEVRGGGAKPWRQKGTGRARAGTIRSPLWRGGGKVFAATPVDHSQKVNKKMYRGAMRAILSELLRQDRLVLIPELKIEQPKTQDLLGRLSNLGLKNVLIVTEDWDDNIYLSARNLRDVGVCQANMVDPVHLIQFEKILITVAAIRRWEEVFK